MSFFKRKINAVNHENSVPNENNPIELVDENKNAISNKRPKVDNANNNVNAQRGGKSVRRYKTPTRSNKSVKRAPDSVPYNNNLSEDSSDESVELHNKPGKQTGKSINYEYEYDNLSDRADELDEENNNTPSGNDTFNIDDIVNGDDYGENRKKYENDEDFIIRQLQNKNSRSLAEVRKLLEREIFSNLKDENNALILEIACQHPRVTRELLELLEKNGNPINDANNLLKKIISNDGINEDDCLDIIKYLIEKYNASKLNALTHVCLSQKTLLKTIKYLMDTTDPLITLKASEFLHDICRNGNVKLDIINHFIENHKVDFNAIIYDGRNLLHWAFSCETVTLPVIKYLIENGVDLAKKDDFKMTPFHQLLENLLKNSGQLNQETINYLSEQKFDAEAIGGPNGYTILQYVCHMQIDPKTVYKVINNSSDYTMKNGCVTRPFGLACRENNLIAVILLLLNGRNLGLNVKKFNIEIEGYLKKYIEGTDLDEKICAEQIQGLITAAKKSRVTLEREVGKLPMECLMDLPAEHLITFASKGCLSKDHLLELKEQNLFSVATAIQVFEANKKELAIRKNSGSKKKLTNQKEFFTSDDRKKFLTFFCCIKNINKNIKNEKGNGKPNKLKLSFPIPKAVVTKEILPHIFYNAAVTASENKNKLKSGSANNPPATFKK